MDNRTDYMILDNANYPYTQRARRDLSLPGMRVHLLYVRTEERKKENLVYENLNVFI